eukprot:CAMPEP_0180030964 /NCGR_PEP_ID=MMETSP0984-20121128/27669_1 /TAXON_ID=483367 /ORGANISM="non described non described, Strain CCMP 2436" /LENGTH=68 /DNA_ID=CAMNT_0021956097 /DNA_START=1367 /DNA_END=1570 /DNA_ORIENTATION=-
MMVGVATSTSSRCASILSGGSRHLAQGDMKSSSSSGIAGRRRRPARGWGEGSNVALRSSSTTPRSGRS